MYKKLILAINVSCVCHYFGLYRRSDLRFKLLQAGQTFGTDHFVQLTLISYFIVGVLLTSFSFKKQSDKPGFKITKWTRPAECKEIGSNFEVGYVLSPLDKTVEIALYLQLTDGSWTVKRFSNKGSGYFKINASDCTYTGNHYGFVKYTDDKETKFPTAEAVKKEHESSDQNPRFKIDSKTAKNECSGTKFETAYVYSPTGKQVEITLFLEKKDKSWRKKIYHYTGTGMIELGIDDCDLTGIFKAHITYTNR